MRTAPLRWFCALVLAGLVETAPSAAPDPQAKTSATPGATPPPDPWPAPAAFAERRRDAERLPLFQTADPLSFTLTADFRAVDRDRDPSSTKLYPATITFAQPDGSTVSRPLQVRGRGHTRRDPKLCDFQPLRLDFAKGEMKGTVFAGQGALKLVTHCRSAALFEQYVLREYTAYRIFNLLTPRSFRVRLAKATYVDAVTGKRTEERNAMFLEDADDVAKRLDGRVDERRIFGFPRLDTEQLTLVTLFEYLIGNTDVAFAAQHNIRVVETIEGKWYPVPYDFDYSGVVNTSYAAVDRKRTPGLYSVRDRVYIGPCRTAAELEPHFAKFRELRTAVYALYDEPALTDASRRSARSYLDAFYRTIDFPGDVKRTFIDACKSSG
jgi:hypothetical protein